jgi:hypothetical protein
MIQALVVIFLLSPPSLAEEVAAGPAATEHILIYNAPFQRLILSSDLRLLHIEERAEYDTPVSSTPSRTSTVETVCQLAPEDATALLRFIQESGFYDLKDAYGAEATARSYPHSIFVRDGVQEKEVVYRSRPDTEAAPEAFLQVEKKISHLIQQHLESHSGGIQ